MDYTIKHIMTGKELDSTLEFAKRIFGEQYVDRVLHANDVLEKYIETRGI